MGGFCVDPSDAADGTCNGPKVVGQTAFIKAGPDASLPQGLLMAYYHTQSKEGMTGFGFMLAIFVMVALTVVTGGAAMGMSMSAVNAAIASNTVFSGIAGLAAAAAGGYAAVSTVASDMRGVDQVQNGFFGNLSDGQLASNMGSGIGGEMNQAIRNKFIYADPLFTVSRNGGMPNYIYGNAGGGNWNAQSNAYMSAFALGDNGGSTCNRAGVKSGACAAPGRMIRPDDFFVQTLAAPDVKSLAEGKVLDRSIDPLRTNYSNDASTNLLMQNIRAANKAKLQEILARRYAAPTPTQ
jgi:hypothetical protein